MGKILEFIWALICEWLKFILIAVGVAVAAVIALIVLGIIHFGG